MKLKEYLFVGGFAGAIGAASAISIAHFTRSNPKLDLQVPNIETSKRGTDSHLEEELQNVRKETKVDVSEDSNAAEEKAKAGNKAYLDAKDSESQKKAYETRVEKPKAEIEKIQTSKSKKELSLEEKLEAERIKRAADDFLNAIDYPIRLFSDKDMERQEIKDLVYKVVNTQEGFTGRTIPLNDGSGIEVTEEYSNLLQDKNAVVTIEEPQDEKQPPYVLFQCKNGLKIYLEDRHYFDIFSKRFKDGEEVELTYREVREHWGHKEKECKNRDRDWLRKKWIITNDGKPEDKFYPVPVNVRVKGK